MTSPSNVVPFPTGSTNAWIKEYQQMCLEDHDAGTIRVYRQILHQFLQWVGTQRRKVGAFDPADLTPPIIERYLAGLVEEDYSSSHCQRVKSVLSQFCQWLVEEKAALPRNPVRGIVITTREPKAPLVLTPVQRSVFLNLVQQTDRRSQALFALGYFAGCRESDIVELRIADTHVGPKTGWLHVGGEGEKARDIDLSNDARRCVYEYLRHREREESSPFLFVSQRGPRLTDAGLRHWWRALKQQASPEEERLIAPLTFHDLRHDFAHRAIDAGWTLEELAYYLGQITTQGFPAVRTAIRYTQVTRAQVKERLKLLKG
jgi:site-specific recombinase XerD